jgi:hypothetical protein
MPSTPPPTYQDAVISGVLVRTGTTPFPEAPRMQARNLRAPSVAPPSVASSSRESSGSSSSSRGPIKVPMKPIVEDPIPRPAEKPRPSPKCMYCFSYSSLSGNSYARDFPWYSAGWQSDTSHTRQKEGIKSYRRKVTPKGSSESTCERGFLVFLKKKSKITQWH